LRDFVIVRGNLGADPELEALALTVGIGALDDGAGGDAGATEADGATGAGGAVVVVAATEGTALAAVWSRCRAAIWRAVATTFCRTEGVAASRPIPATARTTTYRNGDRRRGATCLSA
jgi:hypothetical protein